MSYVQGYLAPVATDRKEEYRRHAEAAWEVFRENGCLAMRETWGVDVPEGKVTSFPMAVKLQPGEAVVFGWMEWPDRETCDRAWEAVMRDPRMQEMEMPFDGARMMWGGFEELLRAEAPVPA